MHSSRIITKNKERTTLQGRQAGRQAGGRGQRRSGRVGAGPLGGGSGGGTSAQPSGPAPAPAPPNHRPRPSRAPRPPLFNRHQEGPAPNPFRKRSQSVPSWSARLAPPGLPEPRPRSSPGYVTPPPGPGPGRGRLGLGALPLGAHGPRRGRSWAARPGPSPGLALGWTILAGIG